MEPLERAYRRLLLAYPRRYRRERGTEILTTLLDAAAPGQRRPARRDALDLVVGGLRCRFAIPRGPLPAAVAILVALLAALGTAAGAGRLAWRAASPAPDLASARAVADAAIPLPPVREPDQYDDALQLTADGNFDPASAWAGFSYAVPPSAIPAEVGAARERLLAAGWEAGPVRDDHGLVSFWAARGDHVVNIGGYPGDPGATEPLWANVHGRAPGWFGLAVLAAALAGGAAGWLAAGWAMRRARRPGGGPRGPVVVFGGIGLLAGTPLVLNATYHGVGAVATGGWSTMDAMFPAVALAAYQPLGLFAGAWLLIAALAAALPPGPSSGVAPWRLGLWMAASAHLAFAAAWCLVVGLYLGHLAFNGGDRQGMLHGGVEERLTIGMRCQLVCAERRGNGPSCRTARRRSALDASRRAGEHLIAGFEETRGRLLRWPLDTSPCQPAAMGSVTRPGYHAGPGGLAASPRVTGHLSDMPVRSGARLHRHRRSPLTHHAE